jgi:predicted SnoaL-like aldol condensation-catalyzing enzyme
MSLFPDDEDIIDKNINPLTRVAMSKSIPKKCAKTFGVSVESIFEGDLVRYHTEEELKLKGIDKATYLQEFLINYENDIKELWPSLEPHMKEYCKLWEEPVV